MEDSERKQRVIGLVTQMYYTLRDDRDVDDPEVTAEYLTLMEGSDFGAYQLQMSAKFPQTPEALQAVITDRVEDAVGQVVRRGHSSLIDMVGLFCDFALHVDQTCPHVDVPEFLRQAGLRAASGGE